MPKSRKRLHKKGAHPGLFPKGRVRALSEVRATRGAQPVTTGVRLDLVWTASSHCELCALSAEAKRSGVAMDIEKVAVALARTGTAVELEG